MVSTLTFSASVPPVIVPRCSSAKLRSMPCKHRSHTPSPHRHIATSPAAPSASVRTVSIRPLLLGSRSPLNISPNAIRPLRASPTSALCACSAMPTSNVLLASVCLAIRIIKRWLAFGSRAGHKLRHSRRRRLSIRAWLAAAGSLKRPLRRHRVSGLPLDSALCILRSHESQSVACRHHQIKPAA